MYFELVLVDILLFLSYQMAPLIEARSLSELVALAANPPAELSLVNSIGKSHEPLVLYIARVPGSKGW